MLGSACASSQIFLWINNGSLSYSLVPLVPYPFSQPKSLSIYNLLGIFPTRFYLSLNLPGNRLWDKDLSESSLFGMQSQENQQESGKVKWKKKKANNGLITKPVTTMGNWSVSPWVYSRKESKIYIRIISPQGTRQLESLYANSHQLLVECCCQECYFPVLLICCAWAEQLWRSEKVSGKRCKCWLEVWCVHRKEKGQRDTVRTLTLKDRWKA